jgi:hypothetical protein
MNKIFKYFAIALLVASVSIGAAGCVDGKEAEPQSPPTEQQQIQAEDDCCS